MLTTNKIFIPRIWTDGLVFAVFKAFIRNIYFSKCTHRLEKLPHINIYRISIRRTADILFLRLVLPSVCLLNRKASEHEAIWWVVRAGNKEWALLKQAQIKQIENGTTAPPPSLYSRRNRAPFPSKYPVKTTSVSFRSLPVCSRCRLMCPTNNITINARIQLLYFTK